MKAITIEFVGEASIKENKVVVDYTELKELMNNHESLLEAVEAVGDTLAYIVNHADIGVIYDEAKVATEKAREAIKAAEKP